MYTIQIAFQFLFWLKLSEEVCKIIYLLLNLCIFSLKKKKKRLLEFTGKKREIEKKKKNIKLQYWNPFFHYDLELLVVSGDLIL